MKARWTCAVIACLLAGFEFGCVKKEAAPAATPAQTEAAPSARAAAVPAPEKPQPYSYPAPVKGHYSEVNVGSFDLVDGIAYKSLAGTVVFVASKAIASPILAGSPCPMTQARALLALRDGSFLEVTLDAGGHSKYFAAGKAFGGSSREEGRGWSSSLKADAGRAKGGVQQGKHGGFQFDLPVSTPVSVQVSQGEWIQGHRSIDSAAKPTEQPVMAAYQAAHDAALKKDWKGLLAAIGLDDKTSAAVRGLAGIDADLDVFADRFLSPGAAGEFTAQPGKAYVRAEGTNTKGKKFANFYHFAPCGDRLVLVSIAENPQ